MVIIKLGSLVFHSSLDVHIVVLDLGKIVMRLVFAEQEIDSFERQSLGLWVEKVDDGNKRSVDEGKDLQ